MGTGSWTLKMLRGRGGCSLGHRPLSKGREMLGLGPGPKGPPRPVTGSGLSLRQAGFANTFSLPQGDLSLLTVSAAGETPS